MNCIFEISFRRAKKYSEDLKLIDMFKKKITQINFTRVFGFTFRCFRSASQVAKAILTIFANFLRN